MHPAIPHLIELQRIDHQIAVLRGELEAFPKRIREADAKLNGARTGVATAKEAHTNSQKERKKFELDVEQWKDRARKYRDQSGAVKTNEAYKALQHEKICAIFTRASPSGTTGRRSPRRGTNSAAAAECAYCRTSCSNSGKRPTKRCTAARPVA